MHTVYANPKADHLNRLGLHGYAAEVHLERSSIGWSTSPLMRVAALREAGNSYAAAWKYELAQDLYEQAREQATQLEAHSNIPALCYEYGLLLCAMARVSICLEEYEEAYKLAQQADLRFKKVDDADGSAIAASLRGQSLLGRCELDAARQELSVAHERLSPRSDEWLLENTLALMRVLKGSPRISLGMSAFALVGVPMRYRTSRLGIALETWSLFFPPWPIDRDRQLTKIR